jgi:DnaJ family protein C protein 9
MSQDEDLAGELPASINPYEVLEVDEKATADEIKSAYRKKALKHHPGLSPHLTTNLF